MLYPADFFSGFEPSPDCAPNHPFFVIGKGFVKAGTLTTSDILVNQHNQKLRIDTISFESSAKPTDVYNIKVQDNHTYYVGLSEVLVHNANCMPKKEYLKKVEENGDRVYERTIDGERVKGPVEIKYTKGANGKYSPRFEDYTHPDYSTPIKPEFEMNGNQAHDAYWMNKQVFGSASNAPDGWTWHHCEDGVHMILVDSDVHGAFHHEGGASVIRGN